MNNNMEMLTCVFRAHVKDINYVSETELIFAQKI